MDFIPDSKHAQTLDNILFINKSQTTELIHPQKISAKEDVWRQSNKLEFYVDFETVSDLNDDFLQFPHRGGQAMIFMIGCGYVHNEQWYFECFIADSLDLPCEKTIIEQWIAYMKDKQQQLCPDTTMPLIYHWSPAEVSTFENAYRSAQTRHPQTFWPNLQWFDFLQEVIREEPVTFKGAFSFGLKSIAKAMYQQNLIQTNWSDGPTDGLGAMVAAWNAHNHRQRKKLPEIELIQDIRKYNEVDCKVMMEIIQYLRINH